MLNSAKIISAVQRKCAICEKIRGGGGGGGDFPGSATGMSLNGKLNNSAKVLWNDVTSSQVFKPQLLFYLLPFTALRGFLLGNYKKRNSELNFGKRKEKEPE